MSKLGSFAGRMAVVPGAANDREVIRGAVSGAIENDALAHGQADPSLR